MRDDLLALVGDLVAIDSVNPSLVPGGAGGPPTGPAGGGAVATAPAGSGTAVSCVAGSAASQRRAAPQ